MTEQKAFKRGVRARMEKTGESYSTARRALLAKAEREAEQASVDDYEPFTSEEAVHENTGRRLGEWFAILDAWGGKERSHKEVARHLMDKHDVPGWWAQNLTVSYERARGMRVKGQRADGSFEATASKTVAAPATRAFEALMDESLRSSWLPDGGLSPKTASGPKSARFDWEDGLSRVLVTFDDRGEKCVVAIAHQKLPGPEAMAEMNAFWRERLAVLKELLEA